LNSVRFKKRVMLPTNTTTIPPMDNISFARILLTPVLLTFSVILENPQCLSPAGLLKRAASLPALPALNFFKSNLCCPGKPFEGYRLGEVIVKTGFTAICKLEDGRIARDSVDDSHRPCFSDLPAKFNPVHPRQVQIKKKIEEHNSTVSGRETEKREKKSSNSGLNQARESTSNHTKFEL